MWLLVKYWHLPFWPFYTNTYASVLNGLIYYTVFQSKGRGKIIL